MSISKIDLLKEKATNFKVWIETFEPDADIVKWIATFKESMLMPTILSQLYPLSQANLLVQTADAVVVKLLKIPEGKQTEVRDKIVRYFKCFVDIATS